MIGITTVLGGALNLKPILELIVGLVVLGAGLALCVFFGLTVLGFLLRILFAPFSLISSMRNGDPVDEFDEIVVFYEGIALVIALIVAGIHFHIFSYE